jgi:hypothetical protein
MAGESADEREAQPHSSQREQREVELVAEIERDIPPEVLFSDVESRTLLESQLVYWMLYWFSDSRY